MRVGERAVECQRFCPAPKIFVYPAQTNRVLCPRREWLTICIVLHVDCLPETLDQHKLTNEQVSPNRNIELKTALLFAASQPYIYQVYSHHGNCCSGIFLKAFLYSSCSVRALYLPRSVPKLEKATFFEKDVRRTRRRVHHLSQVSLAIN
jgi:hypothetical protein